MLTRTRFQEALSGDMPSVPDFKKGNTVVIDGVQKFVMARLQADSENPVTYSVCDTDYRNPRFGISLDNATLAPPEMLTEEVRRRALAFV